MSSNNSIKLGATGVVPGNFYPNTNIIAGNYGDTYPTYPTTAASLTVDAKGRIIAAAAMEDSWEGSTALGSRAHAGKRACAFGTGSRAGDDAIAIGVNIVAEDNEVVIGRVNVTKLLDRLEQLETQVEKQNELIEALWYYPGMPGSQEAAESYATDIKSIQ